MINPGHLVASIMAVHAIRSVILSVLPHEVLVMNLVTLAALLLIAGKGIARCVTVCAFNGAEIIVDLVPEQVEICDCVIKIGLCSQARVELAATVLRMTVCAAIDLVDFSVNSFLSGDLVTHLNVTFFAELVLGGSERCMTTRTLYLKFGVRAKALV
jgi:hypothetical protein